MLKRFILALILLPLTFAGFASQLTATLQSGDKVTPFYGADSFKDAFAAAVDGDVITLSVGKFNVVEVNKAVSIIGAYAFSEDASKMTEFATLTVSADNVTLEGIRFTTSLTIKGADNLSVNRCFIAKSIDESKDDEHKYHNNTIMTDCLIQEYEAMSLSTNTVLRNCGINCFTDANESTDLALIENCNVALFCKYVSGIYYRQPYAIYKSCMLGLYDYTSKGHTLNLYSPSEFKNNYFYESYYENYSSLGTSERWNVKFNSCSNSDNIFNWINKKKSEVEVPHYNSKASTTYNGKTYGPIDSKSYPSIPSITAAAIDSKTDADGLLHVKITATARD